MGHLHLCLQEVFENWFTQFRVGTVLTLARARVAWDASVLERCGVLVVMTAARLD